MSCDREVVQVSESSPETSDTSVLVKSLPDFTLLLLYQVIHQTCHNMGLFLVTFPSGCCGFWNLSLIHNVQNLTPSLHRPAAFHLLDPFLPFVNHDAGLFFPPFCQTLGVNCLIGGRTEET